MLVPRDVALIFDLDNTLIHSTIDFTGVRRRLIDLLKGQGASREPDEDLMALAIPQLVALGEEAGAALGGAMWAVVAAAEAEGLREALPDVHAAAVLRALRDRGYRLALLTNNARPGVTAKLSEFHLADLFEVIVTRSEVTALKPSPAGIHYVLAHLPGVSRAVLIGDAWIDGLAAQAAGIEFVGVGPKQDLALARGATPRAWLADLRALLELDLLASGSTRGA